MRQELLAGAVALTFAAGGIVQAAPLNNRLNSNTDIAPQAAGPVNPNANMRNINGGDHVFNRDRVQLSAAANRALWQAGQDMPAQTLPNHTVGIPGARLPNSIKLSAIPQDARQQVSATLKNDKLVRSDRGRVLLINPRHNTVEAVITRREGTGHGTNAPNALGQRANRSADASGGPVHAGYGTVVNGTVSDGPQESSASRSVNAATHQQMVEENRKYGRSRSHGHPMALGQTRIALSPLQQQAIFNAGKELKTQDLPRTTAPAPGLTLPKSVQLTPMPQKIKQKMSSGYRLRRYSLVHANTGDVLVVDPENRIIQAVIPKQKISTVGQK